MDFLETKATHVPPVFTIYGWKPPVLQRGTVPNHVRGEPQRNLQNLLKISDTSKCSWQCKQTLIRTFEIYVTPLDPLAPQFPSWVAPSTCANPGAEHAPGQDVTWYCLILNAASTTFHGSSHDTKEDTAVMMASAPQDLLVYLNSLLMTPLSSILQNYCVYLRAPLLTPMLAARVWGDTRTAKLLSAAPLSCGRPNYVPSTQPYRGLFKHFT